MKPTYPHQREEGAVLVLGKMHGVGIIVLQISGGFSEGVKKKVKRHAHMDGKTHYIINVLLKTYKILCHV